MDNRWVLEGVAVDGSHVVHAVDRLPFSVGREPGNHLVVQAKGLSRRHAQLSLGPTGRLQLTDLGSTNGTFVNHQRLSGPQPLADNDVIHFGTAEFRLTLLPDELMSPDSQAIDGGRTVLAPPGRTLSGHFVPYERQFLELLHGRGLSGAVQRIVDAHTRAPFAYELLGRGTHPDLPASPIRLFAMAERLEREVDLSRAFRDHGLKTLASRLAGQTLFVNTHPNETFDPAFLASLPSVVDGLAPIRLVIEVHETAVMEVARMRELAARLKDIGVRFAYDDFGAGQARLNELGEVPAHFVKFDMGLIRGLDAASPGKQKVVADLVRIVRELGSVPLAEGVETEGEATVCREMGFALIQGFLTGRPVALDEL